MADNKVNFLRGTSVEYKAATKDNDTFYYTIDDGKLYLGETEITGGDVTIDDSLSDTSKNPVQNKVINAALNTKAELTDIPDKLPADGGNADTVDGLHAADLMQIINLGSTSTDTKTAVGIAGKVTAYWCSAWTDLPTALPDGQGTIIAINYKGSGTAGTDGIWARQFFYSASAAFSNPRIYTRYIKATNVSDWTDISDGGNAATVGGAAVVTSAALGLHRMASGTDEATTTNCPVGCWYGRHS